MRWLGLLVLASCTLLTDPDSFEGSGSDSGVDASVDAPGVDAPGVDAPGLDVPGVDTSVFPPGCCGPSCVEPAPGVVVTAPQLRWQRELGGSPPPLEPELRVRRTQLIAGASADETYLTRRIPTGYELYPLSGDTDPERIALRDWLTDNLDVRCLDPRQIIDLDIQRLATDYVAAIAQPSTEGGESARLTHAAAGCVADDLVAGTLPTGFVSATPMRAIAAVETSSGAALAIGAETFPYAEVSGVAANGGLMVVLNREDGINVEYWTNGARHPGLGSDPFTAPPSIASIGRDEWLVAFGVGGDLAVDRVRPSMGAPVVEPIVTDSIPVGGRIAIATADPGRNLAVVAATSADERQRLRVSILDYGTGDVTSFFDETLDAEIVGVDVLVQPGDPGPPLITWVAETNTTNVWQSTLCGPAP